jgi:Family of unknown function (DUF6289)
MKSRLIKRSTLLALAMMVSLIALALSSAPPTAALNEEVTYHYYSCCYYGVDPDSSLLGERTIHCDGHVSRWGQITQYYTVDSVPCP